MSQAKDTGPKGPGERTNPGLVGKSREECLALAVKYQLGEFLWWYLRGLARTPTAELREMAGRSVSGGRARRGWERALAWLGRADPEADKPSRAGLLEQQEGVGP